MARSNLTFQVTQNNTYLTVSNLPSATSDASVGSDSGSNSFYLLMLGGINNAGNRVATTYKRNLSSWTTEGASGFTTRALTSMVSLQNNNYASGGNPDTSLTILAAEKFNGSSWTNYSGSPMTAYAAGGAGSIPSVGLGYFLWGFTGLGSNGLISTFSLNPSDTVTSVTSGGAAVGYFSCGFLTTLSKLYKIKGLTTGSSSTSAVTSNNSFNSVAWTSEISHPVAGYQSGTSSNSGFIKTYGGNDSAGSLTTASYQFNGTSWSSITSLSTITSALQAGSF